MEAPRFGKGPCHDWLWDILIEIFAPDRIEAIFFVAIAGRCTDVVSVHASNIRSYDIIGHGYSDVNPYLSTQK